MALDPKLVEAFVNDPVFMKAMAEKMSVLAPAASAVPFASDRDFVAPTTRKVKTASKASKAPKAVDVSAPRSWSRGPDDVSRGGRPCHTFVTSSGASYRFPVDLYNLIRSGQI